MYACPNCGGALRFDIPSQQLKCEQCGTQMEPHSYEKEQDAEVTTEYETTVFTCPQCGGEILTADNTAAAFCSYCGAPVILDSSIRKEKRPRLIIPFQKTKEDCKKSYIRLMRQAWFAPKELKDPSYIDSFRGIYMPYWLYVINQQGEIDLEGTESYRSGDYIVTDHYNLSCDVDASYAGMSYDASSSFSDTISEEIAPFDAHEVKDFTPSYLCGFYADTADVADDVYLDQAYDTANQETYGRACAMPEFAGVEIHPARSMMSGNGMNSVCDRKDSAMFPVWFLAYRKKDRVAYATINGQTGKAAADLPVDEKKFVAGSVLLALPIFFLLNTFLTLTPGNMLLFAAIFTLVGALIYLLGIRAVVQHNDHDDDLGFLTRGQGQTAHAADSTGTAGQTAGGSGTAGQTADSRHSHKPAGGWKKRTGKKGGKGTLTSSRLLSYIVIGSIIFYWGIGGIFSLLLSIGAFAKMLIPVLVLLAFLVILFLCGRYAKQLQDKTVMPEICFCFIGAVTAAAILFLHPVSDYYYYGGTIFVYLCIFATLLGLIGKYNILATRQLPQFDRKGGDDRA